LSAVTLTIAAAGQMRCPGAGMAGGRSAFRQDINGLRAVAVVAVTLFHFEVPGFAGGFTGVDLFFVISGFLMTKIILEAKDDGSFSLRDFYLARLLRIFPPMLAMIVALLALGYFFLEPTEYLLLAQHALAALVSVIDVTLYRETAYFAPGRETLWLLHLWSLSVEVQFYLLFPLFLLWAGRRGGHRGLVWRLGGLLALSLIGCILLTFRDPSAAFYLLPARVWEFLAGSLAYPLGGRLRPRWRASLSLIGLAAVIVSIPVLSPSIPFPGYAAILPVTGAALIVAAAATPGILTNPLSQFLGRISYSLYLWHWPVWVAARHFRVEASATHIIELLSLCLVLALASHYAVERPAGALGRKAGKAKPVALLVLCCSVTLFTAGAVVGGEGFPQRAPAMITAEMPPPADIRQDACFLSPPASGDDFGRRCFDPPWPRQGDSVLLWGDSHAGYLWPGVATSRPLQASRLLQATAGACPPLHARKFDPAWAEKKLRFDPVTSMVVHCDAINQRVLDEIAQIRPQLIVLFARWAFYDTHGTDVIGDLHRVVGAISATSPASRIIVIGPIPEWQPTLPQRAFQESFLHGGSVPERLHDPSQPAGEQLDRRMARSFEGTAVRYVSLFKLLCADSGCMAWVPDNGKPALMQWDIAHLSEAGARWIVAHAIAPVVLETLGSHEFITNH